MIIKKYLNHNLYGKYFLATEAPEDEVVTDETKVKRNVKVIAVKPDNRRRTDFVVSGEEQVNPETTDVNQDELDTEDTTDMTGEETPEPEQQTDTTDTAEPVETEPVDDNPDEPDTGDETDMTGDETGDATGTGEEQPVGDGDGTDELDTGGEEDFTGDNTETGDETTDDMRTDDTTGGDEMKPGVEFDSTRKYNLFKEYMSLYNACENYISKLENILKDDTLQNQLIRICVNNLREIKDVLYDYMTIRYSINSYVQSLLFYQKMVVAVQLVFDLLRTAFSKDNEKK